jgi:hypothetical protein
MTAPSSTRAPTGATDDGSDQRQQENRFRAAVRQCLRDGAADAEYEDHRGDDHDGQQLEISGAQRGPFLCRPPRDRDAHLHQHTRIREAGEQHQCCVSEAVQAELRRTGVMREVEADEQVDRADRRLIDDRRAKPARNAGSAFACGVHSFTATCGFDDRRHGRPRNSKPQTLAAAREGAMTCVS